MSPPPPTSNEPSIIRHTLRALLQPQRLLPVILVTAALGVAQHSYSQDPLAVPLALLMGAVFVVVAPVSWRVLFPQRLDLRHGGVRLVLYGAIGTGVVLSVSVVVPGLLQMGPTLLTERAGLVVSLMLFLVGGWGLGQGIWLENRLAHVEARAADLSREAERAQLLALRSQLDPHFLFNTLNAIAEWCREDGETAERAVLQLSGMLRAVLAGVQAPTWSLREELALVDTLFSLHSLRDPTLIDVRRDVAAALPDARLPPLLLLPLAENAVKHGPAAGHRGPIELRVVVDGSDLVVTLANAGAYQGPRAGAHGIETVERRLAVAYEGRATLSIGGQADRTTVQVRLPLAGPVAGPAM